MSVRKYLTEISKESRLDGEEFALTLGDLKEVIKYKLVDVKCCGTCMYYRNGGCFNTTNIWAFVNQMPNTKLKQLPPGMNIMVTKDGLCPNFRR